MNTKIVLMAVLVFIFSAMLVTQAITPARAEEADEGYPIDLYEAPEGYAEIVWGAYFEVVNSTYLNVTITSTVAVNMSLESVPRIVSFLVEGNGYETTTDLAFTGFVPSTTYYRHQDGYLMEEFTTDSSGGYAYTQDISEPHHVYILEYASTLYISTDYTFTSDIYVPIVVAANNIVIDGNGYTLQGPGSGYGFYLNGRSGVTIKNVTVKGWTDGIVMYYSSGNTLKYSTITLNSRWGIRIHYGSSYNVVTNCDLSYNGHNGISFGDWYGQRYNTIMNSRVYSNWGSGIEGYITTDGTKVMNNTAYSNLGHGIQVGWSTWTIENNTVYDNNLGGILLDTAGYCTVKNNNIYLNTHGILIGGLGGYYNTITNNSVYLNGMGISAGGNSWYNRIYHNNFIDNTFQVGTDWGTGNAWDNGYPSGGNYWSSYVGLDEKSGPGQDQPGSDGIGDTPYYLPVQSGPVDRKDRYPLMDYALAPPLVPVATIHIRPDGTVDPIAAPIRVSGNIYTFTSDIFEPIIIEKDNIVVDGDGYTLQGSGWGTGFTLGWRTGVTIKNTVIKGWTGGIEMWGSTRNTIVGNTISENSLPNGPKGGLFLFYASENTIHENNISNNYFGIIVNGPSNKIYHNNFISNKYQVYQYTLTNFWDDGYPSGGNFWSDYVGVDLKSGVNQDQPGSDGIGDTPYISKLVFLPWEEPPRPAQDRYPFMQQSGWIIQHHLTVQTDPLGITTIPGEGWYDASTDVSLQAPAIVPVSTGVQYRFDYWTVDGDHVSGNPITVHMDANHTATAHYVKQYYLTVVSNYDTPGGEGWYDEGETAYALLAVGLEYVDGLAYGFVGWSGDATGWDLLSDPITMDSPKTAIASWESSEAYGDVRTVGFWKHQVNVWYFTELKNNGMKIRGIGTAQVSQDELLALLKFISDNSGYVTFQGIWVEGNKLATLENAYNILKNPSGPDSMKQRTEQQLLAVWLNLAYKAFFWNTQLSQDTIYTYYQYNFENEMGLTTIGEAILFCEAELDKLDGNYEAAKDICDSINNNLGIIWGT